MKIQWLLSEYDEIKALTFAPQVDIVGQSLPINEFVADVVSDEPLPVSDISPLSLSDDRNKLWAQYYATDSYRINERTVRVYAKSGLYKLEYRTLTGQMYQAEPVTNILDAIFGSEAYTLHSSLQSETITGYCPEQTARERLTWLCFVLGAYVVSAFREGVNIRPVDTTETVISPDRTFWRPQVSYSDWVTAVKVTAYTFTQAASEAEWQNDDSSYKFPLPWVATETSVTLTNPFAPQGTPENAVTVDEMYLVNTANVSDIASRLANYYFNRMVVELDCVNNRDYRPGDRVVGFLDAETLVSGYIQSASFKFGQQARSKLKLIGVEDREGYWLTIQYMYEQTRIGQMKYKLPEGYAFSIPNPYLDRTSDGHRYVYRPTTEDAEGTMVEGGMTVTVQYAVALDLYEGVLSVISVDAVDVRASGEEYVGVIA